MNIVCLLGSPRARSNSSTIAGRFADTAGKLGAEVKTYTLNDLKFRGCQACMACKKKSDKCVLKDDLAKVLEAIRGCDVLLLASPVYYGNVSSQLKACIDRLYSFLIPEFETSRDPHPVRLAAGKKLVFVLAQGQPESAFEGIFPNYDQFMKWYGFEESHLIRACDVIEAGAVEARPDILNLAEETARKVCSN